MAKFMDAVMIGVIAQTANIIFVTFLGPLTGILQLLIYLYLVSKYFETDYVRAAIVAVFNVIIGIGITYLITYLIEILL